MRAGSVWGRVKFFKRLAGPMFYICAKHKADNIEML